MACFHPVDAFQSVQPKANGKHKIYFKCPSVDFKPIQLPCGGCIGCRLERSRQWAIRCSHEASLTPSTNAFITLTYNDANLPPSGSLNYRDFQLFNKRLRKEIGPFRFYMCGEYGEELGRPHYHSCVFGKDFEDKKAYKKNHQGDILYQSKILTDTWGKGHCLTGDVTFQSAAYCARYIMKKINGDQSEKHYERMDPETGEFFQLRPEFTNMSRGGTTGQGGIGKQWLEKYASDIYPHDFVAFNGSSKKHRTPKYYDTQYEVAHPDEMAQIKLDRVDNALKHADNNTPERLRVREIVQEAKSGSLLRKL